VEDWQEDCQPTDAHAIATVDMVGGLVDVPGAAPEDDGHEAVPEDDRSCQLDQQETMIQWKGAWCYLDPWQYLDPIVVVAVSTEVEARKTEC